MPVNQSVFRLLDNQDSKRNAARANKKNKMERVWFQPDFPNGMAEMSVHSITLKLSGRLPDGSLNPELRPIKAIFWLFLLKEIKPGEGKAASGRVKGTVPVISIFHSRSAILAVTNPPFPGKTGLDPGLNSQEENPVDPADWDPRYKME